MQRMGEAERILAWLVKQIYFFEKKNEMRKIKWFLLKEIDPLLFKIHIFIYIHFYTSSQGSWLRQLTIKINFFF